MESEHNNMEGFVDREAIYKVLESAIEPLRSLGMTFRPEEVILQIVDGGVLAVCPILIRESAKQKVKEAELTGDAFSEMMEASAESRITNELESIRRELLGLECLHENVHPTDNFCFDCQEEVINNDT